MRLSFKYFFLALILVLLLTTTGLATEVAAADVVNTASQSQPSWAPLVTFVGFAGLALVLRRQHLG